MRITHTLLLDTFSSDSLLLNNTAARAQRKIERVKNQ